jgi:osmotically-inducible protein OsmY
MRKWIASIAIGLAVAIVAGAMYVRHTGDKISHARVRADVLAPQLTDLQIAAALRRANVPLDGMTVQNVDGIVLLRGHADEATATKAVAAINGLGFTRVANLVSTVSFDDEGIRRAAERQLAQARSLDGCMLKVSCLRGVIRVSGTVQNELQLDVARNVLRTVEGAQDVQLELKKL